MSEPHEIASSSLRTTVPMDHLTVRRTGLKFKLAVQVKGSTQFFQIHRLSTESHFVVFFRIPGYPKRGPSFMEAYALD
jgi:hypothetical protein